MLVRVRDAPPLRAPLPGTDESAAKTLLEVRRIAAQLQQLGHAGGAPCVMERKRGVQQGRGGGDLG